MYLVPFELLVLFSLLSYFWNCSWACYAQDFNFYFLSAVCCVSICWSCLCQWSVCLHTCVCLYVKGSLCDAIAERTACRITVKISRISLPGWKTEPSGLLKHCSSTCSLGPNQCTGNGSHGSFAYKNLYKIYLFTPWCIAPIRNKPMSSDTGPRSLLFAFENTPCGTMSPFILFFCQLCSNASSLWDKCNKLLAGLIRQSFCTSTSSSLVDIIIWNSRFLGFFCPGLLVLVSDLISSVALSSGLGYICIMKSITPAPGRWEGG